MMKSQNQPSNYQFFKTLAIGFTIVSFGIAIGVGGYILGTRNSQSLQDRVDEQSPVIFPTQGAVDGNKPLPSTVPDTGETANWKTYTNTNYGYSINYPNNWAVKNLESVDPKTIELVAFNPGQVENEFSAVNIIVSNRNYEQELELLGPNAEPAKVNYVNATRARRANPDGKEYIIVLFNLNKGQNALRIEAKSEHQITFDQILSTFKFIQ